MDWQAVTLLGACGGAIATLIDLASAANAWRDARRRARIKRQPEPPRITDYVDAPADSLVFLTRILLGAVAGLAFHNQVSGIPAALAVGVSAPALLRQLGSFRRIEDAREEGTGAEPSASESLNGTTPAIAGEKKIAGEKVADET